MKKKPNSRPAPDAQSPSPVPPNPQTPDPIPDAPFTEETALAFFARHLDGLNWKYHRYPEKPVLYSGFNGDNVQWDFSLYARETSPGHFLLGVNSFIPTKTPADRRPAIMELLTRINFDLAVGCFELDLADGEIRFRTSIILPAPNLSASPSPTGVGEGGRRPDEGKRGKAKQCGEDGCKSGEGCGESTKIAERATCPFWEQTIEHLLRSNLSIVDERFPQITAVLYTGASPEEALKPKEAEDKSQPRFEFN
jgi:hypothetical protein